jgi:chorismate mutase / prephenate dehydratase
MSLDELRGKIDAIDEKILALLSERGKTAKAIAALKLRANASPFVPSRERQVFERILQQNPGPISNESLQEIYEQIIAACRLLEAPLSVAYLGPPGTFSHLAASNKFSREANLQAFGAIEDVFSEVEHKRADFGVVPVENSAAGVERTTLDRFVNSLVKIYAESYVEVRNHLLSKSPLEEIRRVLSHPQPLLQCREWLRANLPRVETVEVSSTARAAQLAAEEAGAAAIGTELAASLYGLPIVASGIQDRPDNRTRFLILGLEEAAPSGKDKTSLMFSVHHRSGALWEILGILQRHGINLTMIESRPTKQTPWQYVFFVDVQGHERQAPLAEALRELGEHTVFLKVLGSYPEAE